MQSALSGGWAHRCSIPRPACGPGFVPRPLPWPCGASAVASGTVWGRCERARSHQDAPGADLQVETTRDGAGGGATGPGLTRPPLPWFLFAQGLTGRPARGLLARPGAAERRRPGRAARSRKPAQGASPGVTAAAALRGRGGRSASRGKEEARSPGVAILGPAAGGRRPAEGPVALLKGEEEEEPNRPQTRCGAR